MSIGSITTQETPESEEIAAKECNHKLVFVGEEKTDTWFGGYDYTWVFECEHCGNEQEIPAPYSWNDDRNYDNGH